MNDPEIINLSPMDASFLLMESPNAPAHFAGLEIFSRPPGQRRSPFRQLVKQYKTGEFSRPFNQRLLRGSWLAMRPPRWNLDEEFDFDYHVRHIAVPAPGRMEDLLSIIARIHAAPMNTDHPLWEYYFIDGLEHRRFAIYRKTHHSLVDGVGSISLLKQSYSESPEDSGVRAPWNPPEVAADKHAKVPFRLPTPQSLRETTRRLAGFAAATVADKMAGKEDTLPLPWTSPPSPFNVPVSPHRRICLRTFSLGEMQSEARRLGVTINDIFLTMCSGTIHNLLEPRGELPERSMTALIPVSLRKSGSTQNHIAFVICELGTQLDSTGARLDWIIRSMNKNREFLNVLPGAGASAISLGFDLAWIAQKNLLHTIPGMAPIANLVLSNVPGPSKPLWMDGSRLEGIWPLSVLMDGQALNITVASYVDRLHAGIVACRHVVDDVEEIGNLLERELEAIKKLKKPKTGRS